MVFTPKGDVRSPVLRIKEAHDTDLQAGVGHRRICAVGSGMSAALRPWQLHGRLVARSCEPDGSLFGWAVRGLELWVGVSLPEIWNSNAICPRIPWVDEA